MRRPGRTPVGVCCEAAAETFAERGYHDTRIDSLSRSGAGVAKGTIYNYFPSKEAVLETLVAEACQLAADAATRTPDDAPTRARLEAFVAANLRWARRRQSLAVLFARELLAGDAEIKRLIRRAAAPVRPEARRDLSERHRPRRGALGCDPAGARVHVHQPREHAPAPKLRPGRRVAARARVPRDVSTTLFLQGVGAAAT